VLASVRPHDPGLGRVHGEAFVRNDPADGVDQSVHRQFRAGEREVVGVSRVAGPMRSREAGQSAVEPVGDEIGERRRGRCALRQVRTPESTGRIEGKLRENTRRGGRGAESGEHA
jgi:hypothetical protein